MIDLGLPALILKIEKAILPSDFIGFEMIEVHEVEPNWTPPEKANWVGVYIMKAGTLPLGWLEGVTDDPPKFFSSNNAPDIASAIDQAREWAAANSISNIYVIRGAD